ncbi:MAG TPA: hypothetical protein VLG71_00090 [Candidatus Limnocylindria bacterium]|nr:hypothetical protein [Candidatus Limnocylindria bacterium]
MKVLKLLSCLLYLLLLPHTIDSAAPAAATATNATHLRKHSRRVSALPAAAGTLIQTPVPAAKYGEAASAWASGQSTTFLSPAAPAGRRARRSRGGSIALPPSLLRRVDSWPTTQHLDKQNQNGSHRNLNVARSAAHHRPHTPTQEEAEANALMEQIEIVVLHEPLSPGRGLQQHAASHALLHSPRATAPVTAVTVRDMNFYQDERTQAQNRVAQLSAHVASLTAQLDQERTSHRDYRAQCELGAKALMATLEQSPSSRLIADCDTKVQQAHARAHAFAQRIRELEHQLAAIKDSSAFKELAAAAVASAPSSAPHVASVVSTPVAPPTLLPNRITVGTVLAAVGVFCYYYRDRIAKILKQRS